MTVQPVETGTTLDLELLIGDMPAVPCEHSEHNIPGLPHDDGPATRYSQTRCTFCRSRGPVIAVCKTFANWALGNWPLRCRYCLTPGRASEVVTILGPVNSLG
jgi:hypothetical protein